MTEPRGEEAVSARISQKVAVGVVFVAAMLMSIMDATIVNVALPTIGRDFGVSPTAVDSISIAFLVSLAVFIPASGGHAVANLTAYRAAFLVAAAICLSGVAWSLSISRRRGRRHDPRPTGPARGRVSARAVGDGLTSRFAGVAWRSVAAPNASSNPIVRGALASSPEHDNPPGLLRPVPSSPAAVRWRGGSDDAIWGLRSSGQLVMS